MKRVHLFYCLIFSAAAGILIFMPMLSEEESVGMWELINRLSFYDVSVGASIDRFFMDLFPYILFQLVWGTYVYERFCTASIYFFSRKDNKGGWYLGECAKLYLWGVFYLVCLVSVSIAMVSLGREITLDKASVYIAAFYILLYSFFLFATALLVNLLALRIKSVYGFGIVVSVELLAAGAYEVLGNWICLTEEENNAVGMRLFALKCDPLSHLVLKWHGSFVGKVDGIINGYGLSFRIEESALAWAVAAVVVVVFGYAVIKRTEFIENEKE